MDYVWFSAGFFPLHLGAYVIAGVLNLYSMLFGGFAAWLLF